MDKNKRSLVFILACSLSIVIALFFTYKITNPQILIPEADILEYPVSSSKYLIKQQEMLNILSNNFNNRQLINKYFGDGDIVKAMVEGNTIIVQYSCKGVTDTFKFILNSDSLSSSVYLSKRDVFIKIFKIMFEANQIRLGNNLDFTNYFNEHLDDSVSEDAIMITRYNDEFDYIIYIDEKITNE